MAQMATDRIDVSIEDKRGKRDAQTAKGHPNTCPACGSHYRDDELVAHLRVCPQCGHHFPVRAHERVEQLADIGTFEECDSDLRSADPLGFFDLRPYAERIAEAEVTTGLGDAMVTGSAAVEESPCELAVMDFAFLGGSMGSVVGESSPEPASAPPSAACPSSRFLRRAARECRRGSSRSCKCPRRCVPSLTFTTGVARSFLS